MLLATFFGNYFCCLFVLKVFMRCGLFLSGSVDLLHDTESNLTGCQSGAISEMSTYSE